MTVSKRLPGRVFTLLITLLTLSPTLNAADKITDFTLTSLDGKRFKLTDELKKGPVLIDFWATWCKPCVQALPHLQKIKNEFAGKGLQVVSITIDNPKSQSKVKPFIKSAGYDFNVLLDADMSVRKSLGGQDIPLTLLIDQNGNVSYRHLGYVPGDEEKLKKAVIALLAAEKSN